MTLVLRLPYLFGRFCYRRADDYRVLPDLPSRLNVFIRLTRTNQREGTYLLKVPTPDALDTSFSLVKFHSFRYLLPLQVPYMVLPRL